MTKKNIITLNIDINEEITSIIDRLKKAEEQEIKIIIPKSALILRSIINLKLIKKQADKENKKITVLLEDKQNRDLAKRAGLNVAENQIEDEIVKVSADKDINEVKEIKNIDYNPEDVKVNVNSVDSIRRKEFLNRSSNKFPAVTFWRKDRKKIENVKKDFLAKYNLNNKKRGMDTQPKSASSSLGFGLKLFFFFLLASLALTVIVVFLILPTVDINIKTKSEELSADIQLTIDSNIEEVNLETYNLPGYLVESTIEKEQEFFTTGEDEISEKAKGTITVYNEWSSQSQTLVETTRFLSLDGKLFRTIKTVVVPGAEVTGGRTLPGTVTVEVEADVAGEEYNIEATDFSIPGFEGTVKHATIYGKSFSLMTGGETKTIKIASADDIDKARTTLSDACLDEASSKLKEILEERKAVSDNISDDLKLLDFAIKEQVINESSSLKVGEEGEKFTFTMKIKAQGIVFDENNLKMLVENYFSSSLPEEKEIITNTEDIVYRSEAKNIDFDKGKMVFNVDITGDARWKIDADYLRSLIAGKNEEELRSFFINMAEVEKVEVSFWPFWVKKVPVSGEKINIYSIDE